ncbi:hypothetical protein D3C71_713950 [compost metagenome]
MTGADLSHATNHIDWVDHQFIYRNVLVADAVDEGGVGAVFQEASNQIGKQCFMGADGSVDTCGAAKFACADNLVIERLPHSMQALEFVFAALEFRPGDIIDRRQSLRIMGRKLREYSVGRRQQFAGTGNVGNIGMDLTREDWKILQPVHLSTFDFRIPIGALDETNHDATAVAAGEIDDEVEHGRATLAIGLHDEAHALPAGEIRIFAKALQKIERQFETVSLLGIDVEADIVFFRQASESLHLRQEFAHDTFGLCADITWVQCRELDGNARTVIDAATGRREADGVDRLFIILVVALGICRGRRSLAQHVIGVAEPAFLQRLCTLQRLGNRFTGDELLAHHAHCHVDAAADDWFATTGDQPGERGRKAAAIDRVGKLAGDDEAPGGGINEKRTATADMGLPIAI